MANSCIEQYLPKSAAYINWAFVNDSEQRGGHHNHVAVQYIINLDKALINQDESELAETDKNLFLKLHKFDNNPACVLILNFEIFDDFAEIVDVFGQGCNYPTKQGVNGIQVDFDVLAVSNAGEEKAFHVVYQTADRNCNLRAYNGIEMEAASSSGCDTNESNELTEFMDWDDNTYNQMASIAKFECFNWLENQEQPAMTPSQQAKTLGCKSLAQVAEFYECTTQHLRNVHKRNNKAFVAIVVGFVSYNTANQS